jgi:hypothetical protein
MNAFSSDMSGPFLSVKGAEDAVCGILGKRGVDEDGLGSG